MVRKVCLVGLAGTAVAAAAVPALAATRSVTVGDDYFVRKGSAPTVTVKRGTTVRWVWRGKSPHNVTVRRGPVRFKSTTKRRGTYSRRLTRRGTYRIVCTVHEFKGQRMTLRVR
jgi:plastocyanin